MLQDLQTEHGLSDSATFTFQPQPIPEHVMDDSRQDTHSSPLARPDLVVCEHCDQVYRHQPLAAGEQARCLSCGSLLYRGGQINLQARLALSLSALVFYLLANVYPLLHIQFKGLQSEATMLQATLILAHGIMAPIAIPVALCMLLAPLLQILLLNWILLYAIRQRKAPGFARLMRLHSMLQPWNMLEVGVLGVLVSMIKLNSLVEVDIGAGVWALCVLVAMLSLILDNDLEQLWTRVPAVSD
jgi:paraquat-inducible protein A